MLTITNDNSALAQIWLAANTSNLGRAPVLQTRIADSASEIAAAVDSPESSGGEYVTLRTSGELLQGIVRVYAKQAGFLLSDLKDALAKINVLFRASARVTVAISSRNTLARMQNIVLEDTVTEKEVLLMPGLDFLADLRPGSAGSRVAGATAVAQSAAMYDTSLELGRQFPGDHSVSLGNTSSLLDLDFGTRRSHGDEGTRAGGSSTLHNPELPQDQDDFPLQDDQFSSEWNMDLGDAMGVDESVEIGRRADGSLVEEHTDFGFDLDIGKDDEADESEVPLPLPVAVQRKRRRRNMDPALQLTEPIIVDMDLVLSKRDLAHVSSNTEAQQQKALAPASRLTRKRLLHEIEIDSEYTHDSLLSYPDIKRQHVELPPDEIDIQPLDMDIELANNDSIDNFDLIGDVDANEDNVDAHQDMDFDLPQDMEPEPLLPTQDSDLSNMTADNEVRLVSGKTAAKEVVHLAETLRDNATAQTTFTQLLQSTGETAEPTRPAASRCFFDLLALASADCIALEQPASYSAISITTQPSLAHKFIPA